MLGPNTLRDSIYQRLELMQFEAYIFVCVTMWATCWEELRAVTNSKSVKLNPLELNDIYDQLRDVGTLLKGEDVFLILSEDYRPWPKLDALSSQSWYSKRDENELTKLRWEMLRDIDSGADAVIFKPVLSKVFALLGESIQVSLERTMGDYLKVTNGCNALSKLEPWMKERAVNLFCHNNPAERPFGVVKLLDRTYQTMSQLNISSLAMARVNGTFASASSKPKTRKTAARKRKPAGAAVLADPELRDAVGNVSSVRKKKTGGVTRLCRAYRVEDEAKETANRKKRRADEIKEQTRLKLVRVQRRDKASSTDLIRSVSELHAHLRAKSGKGTRVALLSGQFDARVTGRSFTYSLEAIGLDYRSKHMKKKSLKKSPNDKQDELDYLTRLMELMITDDVTEGRYAAENLEEAQAVEVAIARKLPVISEEYTSAFSKGLKEVEQEEARRLMVVNDDLELAELTDEYKNQLFYDAEENQTYKVLSVQYDKRGGIEYYEATSVPVEKSDEGSWIVPPRCFVEGTEVVKDSSLTGYYLMNLTDPKNTILYDDVRDMMNAHTARERVAREQTRSNKRPKGGGQVNKPKRSRACRVNKAKEGEGGGQATKSKRLRRGK